MNGVDVAVLILSAALLVAIFLYLRHLKKQGRNINCSCGKKHLSGKRLVDEYHQSHPCCCEGKDKPKA